MSKTFLVEISARHAHISEQDFKVLFGEDASLTMRKELSQPGEFATNEKITVVGPKGQMNFTILGPFRANTQIEVSMTDARVLGVTAPVRESGDVAGSPGTKIIGPKGELEIKEGIIVAKRHIHATPEAAEDLGIKNKEIVSVKLNTDGRSLIFGDVVVRVSEKYALAMHIDTDEANAAGMTGSVQGEIVR